MDDLVDATLLCGYGLADRLEVGLAAPFGLRQTGAGADAATSQHAEPIARSVVRDPRLGAAFLLVPTSGVHGPRAWGMKARLEFGTPLGDARGLAGDHGFVAAPSLVLGARIGVAFFGSELGARLRETSEVAGAHVGSQLSTKLGVGVDVLRRELLSVGIEAWVLPTLASQTHTAPDGSRIEDGVLAPAEWMASLGSAPLASRDLRLALGFGTALPLSSERRVAADGSSATERFAGVTSPRFRAALVVRYAPLRSVPAPGTARAGGRR